ncbi:MAG TPA: twin-arginine translocase TatA/TatE family subunit [Gammaproteobacteria bacterium]|nr:twin-arginine translocase TatA/TatE family subunit [Gammaproteobacteria bacterium]
MGFGGISPWSLLLILLIVVMIFGTKRLKNVGGDLGSAIKSFKKSMADGSEEPTKPKHLEADEAKKVVEGEVAGKQKNDV